MSSAVRTSSDVMYKLMLHNRSDCEIATVYIEFGYIKGIRVAAREEPSRTCLDAFKVESIAGGNYLGMLKICQGLASTRYCSFKFFCFGYDMLTFSNCYRPDR